MKAQTQKKQQNDLEVEQGSNPEKFERSKLSQQYRSYFYRNAKETSEQSPSQSSKTNKQTQGKSRLKSTRVKSKNPNSIYYELEATKKNQMEVLREQNMELKKTIAQLKISQLYQIDEGKIKSLLMEIQQLNSKVKKLQRQNQKLRIQNDFLNRSNTQMKSELSRIRKKDIINDFKQDPIPKYPFVGQLQKNKLCTLRSTMEIPSYLFLGSKRQSHGNQDYQMRRSQTALEKEASNNISIKREKQMQLLKMSSEKYINPRLTNVERRKSKKKINFTEEENNETPFR